MPSKEFLSSKLTVAGLLVLLAFFGNLRYQQWRYEKSVERQKADLYAQEQVLQKKNEELNESLSLLNSPNFKERFARQQLNMKKEGETVFTFSEAGEPVIQGSQEASADEGNPRKWWNYFFNSIN